MTDKPTSGSILESLVTAKIVRTLHRVVFALTMALDEQTYVVPQFEAKMVKMMITTVAKMRQLRITLMNTVKGVKTIEKQNEKLCSPSSQVLHLL